MILSKRVRYETIYNVSRKIYVYELKVKVAQSCLTLFDPMAYTVHGVL